MGQTRAPVATSIGKPPCLPFPLLEPLPIIRYTMACLQPLSLARYVRPQLAAQERLRQPHLRNTCPGKVDPPDGQEN